MNTSITGPRLKALRKSLGLSLEEAAKRLDLDGAATLSSIEAGETLMTGDQLVLVSEKFNMDLDNFLNPYFPIERDSFHWRQTEVSIETRKALERKVMGLITAFRFLSPSVGLRFTHRRTSLNLTRESRLEKASEAAERFALDFDMGQVPAKKLHEIMERQLGILVLWLDGPKDVSGAACRLEELDFVLVNRRESPGHRNFNLAHELFHILTWDSISPNNSSSDGENKAEQLANVFASSLLMPSNEIEKWGDWSSIDDSQLVTRIHKVADHFRVSTSALLRRLVSLGLIDENQNGKLNEAKLRKPRERESVENSAPPLYSKLFVEVIAKSLERCQMSMRRATGLLDMNYEDLRDLFASHGVKADI